jgi:hypothetical protein
LEVGKPFSLPARWKVAPQLNVVTVPSVEPVEAW